LLGKEEITDQIIFEAYEYYKDSRKLRPQDNNSIDRRTAIELAFSEAVAEIYIREANNSLYYIDHLDTSLQRADELVNKALTITPADKFVLSFHRKLNAYKRAIIAIKDASWQEEINNLQGIYEQDQDFAGGVILMLIFEAYMELGNETLQRGFYKDALGYYELALVSAEMMPNTLLPLMQSRTQIALVVGKLGDYEESAELFHSIIEDFDILWRADQQGEVEMQQILLLSEENFLYGDYRNAFLDYVRAFELSYQIYDHTQVNVSRGTNLATLAAKNKSTIQAINAVNDLPYQVIFGTGQELNIPYLSEIQE
jgi:tetratricopeptide (TPR) repeat protein